MPWKVWCEVSGGATGSRAGWLKKDSKEVEFPTQKAAQEAAAILANAMKGAGTPGARFSYTAMEDGI